MDDSFPHHSPSSFSPDEAMIERFLAGECTSEETRLVMQWGGVLPDGRLLADVVRTAVNTDSLPSRDPTTMRDELGARLGLSLGNAPLRSGNAATSSPRHTHGEPQRGMMNSMNKLPLRRWAHIVGAAVVFMGIIVALRWDHTSRPTLSETTQTYATRTGQKAVFTLRDGTRVTLAPRTILRLTRFGARNRTVILDGEAYFDVVQASGAPFVVQTEAVSTRVLGTGFLIKHYHGDVAVHIAVAAGKVNVSTRVPRRPSVTLTAGNVGDVLDSTTIVRTVDNLDESMGWLHDELIFNDAPMTDVLATLTRWYGYQFRYTDSALVQQNVTVGISTQSSAKALAALKQVLNVTLAVSGDTITLTSPPGRTERKGIRHKVYDVWTPSREVGR